MQLTARQIATLIIRSRAGFNPGGEVAEFISTLGLPDEQAAALRSEVSGLLATAVIAVTWPEGEPAPAAEPVSDAQAERLADAYNLGIKAAGLREFADHLAAIEPYVPMTARAVAEDARAKAEELDAKAEALAGASAPAPAKPTTRLREALAIARDALDAPGLGCSDYSDHGPDEAWHCEGCLEAKAAEEAIAVIDAALAAGPAPAVELTEEQQHAEQIIRDLISEAEFDDICDRVDDDPEAVHDLILSATVTVTWARDGEQAEGGQ